MEHSPGVLLSTMLLSLAALTLSRGVDGTLCVCCFCGGLQLLVCSLILKHSVAVGGTPCSGGRAAPPAISWRLALACNVSPFSTAEALNLTWCCVSAVLSQVPSPATSEAPRAACCIRTTSTQGSHLLGHLLHSLFQFGSLWD